MKNKKHSTNEYKIGDLVYCTAFVKQEDIIYNFVCKGIVSRLPTPKSKVYKIIIISICTKSISHNAQSTISKTLLCKKIAREHNQLSYQLNRLMLSYTDNQEWIDITEQAMKQIRRKI